jgi:hypothetical protein
LNLVIQQMWCPDALAAPQPSTSRIWVGLLWFG